MKFKEGDIVELCRADGGFLKSWYRAKIISGKGHTYKVQYESISNADGKPVTEDVCAEAVRPQPPAMTETKRLAVGDVMEAYDNHSWRAGKVVKTLPGRFFVVKFMEPLGEKRCHQSIIRPRLSWQDHQWVRITENDMDLLLETGFQLLKESHIPFQFRDVCVAMNASNQNHGEGEAKKYPLERLAKNEKRKAGTHIQSAYERDLLTIEAAPQKRRALQSLKHQGPVAESAISVREKVDTFPFPRKHVDEECEYMYPFEGRINQSVKEAESTQSSVASNSSTYESNYILHSMQSNQPVVNSPFDGTQSYCECPNMRKSEPLTEMDITAKIHKLELQAYHKTMSAFYASGCLTWKQEALLTDLRLSLHISADEHISELRHLGPAQAL